ncbi:MAG: hypothetical protein ACFFB3_14160 [Candidatus Hodarchaeota archaeon]
MGTAEREAAFNQELIKMLSEFRREFNEFKEEILKEIGSLKEKLAQVSPSHDLTETGGLLQDLGEGSDFLSLITMDLPSHLRSTYLFVLNEGAVSADTVRDEFNISLSQASVHLRQLTVEYDLLDWRKGEKSKGESPHKKYYFPAQRRPHTSILEAPIEDENDEEFKIFHTD